MFLNQKRKKGVTLIEMLIVLAGAVALIAGGMALYGKYESNQNIKTETSNISAIYTGIKNLYDEDSTKGINNKMVLSAGLVPEQMQVSGETIYNSWRGNVNIKENGINGFKVEYTKVPAGEDCVSFVRGQRKIGWTSVKIGKATESDFFQQPLSTVINSCEKGTDGGKGLPIIFTVSD